jgi:hypothetical protein
MNTTDKLSPDDTNVLPNVVPNSLTANVQHIPYQNDTKLTEDDVFSDWQDVKLAGLPQHKLEWNPGQEGKGFILKDGSVWTWPTKDMRPNHDQKKQQARVERNYETDAIPSSNFHINSDGSVWQFNPFRGPDAKPERFLDQDQRAMIANAGLEVGSLLPSAPVQADPYGHAENLMWSLPQIQSGFRSWIPIEEEPWQPGRSYPTGEEWEWPYSYGEPAKLPTKPRSLIGTNSSNQRIAALLPGQEYAVWSPRQMYLLQTLKYRHDRNPLGQNLGNPALMTYRGFGGGEHHFDIGDRRRKYSPEQVQGWMDEGSILPNSEPSPMHIEDWANQVNENAPLTVPQEWTASVKEDVESNGGKIKLDHEHHEMHIELDNPTKDFKEHIRDEADHDYPGWQVHIKDDESKAEPLWKLESVGPSVLNQIDQSHHEEAQHRNNPKAQQNNGSINGQHYNADKQHYAENDASKDWGHLDDGVDDSKDQGQDQVHNAAAHKHEIGVENPWAFEWVAESKDNRKAKGSPGHNEPEENDNHKDSHLSIALSNDADHQDAKEADYAFDFAEIGMTKDQNSRVDKQNKDKECIEDLPNIFSHKTIIAQDRTDNGLASIQCPNCHSPLEPANILKGYIHCPECRNYYPVGWDEPMNQMLHRDKYLPQAMEDYGEGWDLGPIHQGKTATMTLPQEIREWEDLNKSFSQKYQPQSQVVHQFDDGWTVQHHPNKLDINRVGQMMHNCWQSTDGKFPTSLQGTRYMALHDPHGIPRAAFFDTANAPEVWPASRVRQVERLPAVMGILGQRNRPPDTNTIERLKQYADANGYIQKQWPTPSDLGGEGWGYPRREGGSQDWWHYEGMAQCPHCGQGLFNSGRAGWTPVTNGQYEQPTHYCPNCKTDFRLPENRPAYRRTANRLQNGQNGLKYQIWNIKPDKVSDIEHYSMGIWGPDGELIQNAPTTMYHQAPKTVRNSIQQNGLRANGDPDVDPQPAVFMTPKHPQYSTDPYLYHPERNDVWQIDTTGLPIHHDPWGDDYGEDYLGDLGGSFYHPGDIDPSRIRLVPDPPVTHQIDVMRGTNQTNPYVPYGTPMTSAWPSKKSKLLSDQWQQEHKSSIILSDHPSKNPPHAQGQPIVKELEQFLADHDDSREFDDPKGHPELHGCSCIIGEKLTCPIHGMNADNQLGETWHIPENNPVGMSPTKEYTHSSQIGNEIDELRESPAGKTRVDQFMKRRNKLSLDWDLFGSGLNHQSLNQTDNQNHPKGNDYDQHSDQVMMGNMSWDKSESDILGKQSKQCSKDNTHTHTIADDWDKRGLTSSSQYDRPMDTWDLTSCPSFDMSAPLFGHNRGNRNSSKNLGQGTHNVGPKWGPLLGSHKESVWDNWVGYNPGLHGTNFYHAAPTEDRHRIQAFGLQPSSPKNNSGWGSGAVSWQPTGVYMANDPYNTMTPWDVKGDIWKIDPSYISALQRDPLLGGKKWVCPHEIPPEALSLHQPYEHSVAVQPERYDYGRGDVGPTYPEYYDLEDYGKKWGIGLPDRVIGSIGSRLSNSWNDGFQNFGNIWDQGMHKVALKNYSVPEHHNSWTGLPCTCPFKKTWRRAFHLAGNKLNWVLNSPDKQLNTPEGLAFKEHLKKLPEQYEGLFPWMAHRFKKGEFRVHPNGKLYMQSPYLGEGEGDYFDEFRPDHGAPSYAWVEPHRQNWGGISKLDEANQWLNARQHPTRQGVNVLDSGFGVRQMFQKVQEHQKALEKEKLMKEGLSYGKNIYQFPNGWHIHDLTDTNENENPRGESIYPSDALAAEGKAMNHCIGGNPYTEMADNGQLEAYSLRDKKGWPHVTFTYNADGTLSECYGPNDDPVKPEYQDMLNEWADHRGMDRPHRNNAVGLQGQADEEITVPGAENAQEYYEYHHPEMEENQWSQMMDEAMNHGEVGEDTEVNRAPPDFRSIARDLQARGDEDDFRRAHETAEYNGQHHMDQLDSQLGNANLNGGDRAIWNRLMGRPQDDIYLDDAEPVRDAESYVAHYHPEHPGIEDYLHGDQWHSGTRWHENNQGFNPHDVARGMYEWHPDEEIHRNVFDTAAANGASLYHNGHLPLITDALNDLHDPADEGSTQIRDRWNEWLQEHNQQQSYRNLENSPQEQLWGPGNSPEELFAPKPLYPDHLIGSWKFKSKYGDDDWDGLGDYPQPAYKQERIPDQPHSFSKGDRLTWTPADSENMGWGGPYQVEYDHADPYYRGSHYVKIISGPEGHEFSNVTYPPWVMGKELSHDEVPQTMNHPDPWMDSEPGATTYPSQWNFQSSESWRMEDGGWDFSKTAASMVIPHNDEGGYASGWLRGRYPVIYDHQNDEIHMGAEGDFHSDIAHHIKGYDPDWEGENPVLDRYNPNYSHGWVGYNPEAGYTSFPENTPPADYYPKEYDENRKTPEGIWYGWYGLKDGQDPGPVVTNAMISHHKFWNRPTLPDNAPMMGHGNKIMDILQRQGGWDFDKYSAAMVTPVPGGGGAWSGRWPVIYNDLSGNIFMGSESATHNDIVRNTPELTNYVEKYGFDRYGPNLHHGWVGWNPEGAPNLRNENEARMKARAAQLVGAGPIADTPNYQIPDFNVDDLAHDQNGPMWKNTFGKNKRMHGVWHGWYDQGRLPRIDVSRAIVSHHRFWNRPTLDPNAPNQGMGHGQNVWNLVQQHKKRQEGLKADMGDFWENLEDPHGLLKSPVEGNSTNSWNEFMAKTADWYHLAPTTERARIQQHGLQLSSPGVNDHWKGNEDIQDQAAGVYVVPNEEKAEGARWLYFDHQMGKQLPTDMWRIPDDQIQSLEEDPLMPFSDAHIIPHSINQPVLHQPYEDTWEYPKGPSGKFYDGTYPNWNENDIKQLGIGLPDRVIGSWRFL